MSLKKIIITLIFAVSFLYAKVLDMPAHRQEQTNWCWAGCSQMILDYYGKNRSQTEIAKYATGGQNVYNDLYGSKGIEGLIKYFGNISSIGTFTALSKSQVQTITDDDRPFVLRFGWTTGGGHFLVGYGLEDNTCYVMDPWTGSPTINTYEYTVKSSRHIWTHSLSAVTPFAGSPENLTATNIGNSATLNWTAPIGVSVTSYNIYRDGVQIDNTTSTEYVDINLPLGKYSYFVTAVRDNNFESAKSAIVDVYIGGVPVPVKEDFETGNFSKLDWDLTNQYQSWVINSGGGYGKFCAKSGLKANDHSKYSDLKINYDAHADGVISFFIKVSSENCYDYFNFYIDNTPVVSENDAWRNWSGEKAWTKYEYPVKKGQHTFKWSFKKDDRGNSGSDCVWIDDLTLPPQRPITSDIEVEVAGNSSNMLVNYPNPFNAQTVIEYSVNKNSLVSLQLFNSSGQLIKTLVHKNQDKGSYSLTLDFINLNSGVYFCKLMTGSESKFSKMLLVK